MAWCISLHSCTLQEDSAEARAAARATENEPAITSSSRLGAEARARQFRQPGRREQTARSSGEPLRGRACDASFCLRARNRRHVLTIEAGLLAPGSSYWPRLPAVIVGISLREMKPHAEREDYDEVAVARAAVVPGYSGGTATDLHRFPYSFRPATSRRNTSRQGGNGNTAARRVKTLPARAALGRREEKEQEEDWD